MVATVPNANMHATLPQVVGQKGDATHTLNMKRSVPSVSDSPLLCMKMSVFMSMKCPVPSVSQVARCSGRLCQCSRTWSALCHQCHKQRTALSDDVNIYKHEAPCAFSATDSMLSVWRCHCLRTRSALAVPSATQTACCTVWRCQCLRTWSTLWLQCHRQHAPLPDDVNIYEHEVPCALSVADSTLLCVKMSMFLRMKCPVPSVSQAARCSVWQCQCSGTWSVLCLQCHREHAPLFEDVSVYKWCLVSMTKKKRERHPCHKHMCHSPSCPVSWSELTKISPHSAQMASKTSKYLPQHCPATVSDAIRAVINLKR